MEIKGEDKMYDINKRKKMLNVTVGEIIDELTKLPKDATFCCCGDNQMFIHVEKDGTVVSIDTEDLDEDYIDDDDTEPDEYWDARKVAKETCDTSDTIHELFGTLESALEYAVNNNIRHKIGSVEYWDTSGSFIPKKMELIIYVMDSKLNNIKFKIGDGVTNIAELDFVEPEQAVQSLERMDA